MSWNFFAIYNFVSAHLSYLCYVSDNEHDICILLPLGTMCKDLGAWLEPLSLGQD